MGRGIVVEFAGQRSQGRSDHIRAGIAGRYRLVGRLMKRQHFGAAARSSAGAGNGKDNLLDDFPLERRSDIGKDHHADAGFGGGGALVGTLTSAVGRSLVPGR